MSISARDHSDHRPSKTLPRGFDAYEEEFWQPVPHEETARMHYRKLAAVTYRMCRRFGSESLTGMLVHPYHYMSFWNGFARGVADACDPTRWLIPPCPRLAERWEVWGKAYEALLDRNPKIALRETLSDVSERIDASSWPAGYEDEIRSWVDAGAVLPFPLTTFTGDVDEELATRLRALRQQVKGWWFWDDEASAVVFREEEPTAR